MSREKVEWLLEITEGGYGSYQHPVWYLQVYNNGKLQIHSTRYIFRDEPETLLKEIKNYGRSGYLITWKEEEVRDEK